MKKLFSFFEGIDNMQVNHQGLLPQFIEQAKFNPVKIVQHYNTAFGTMQLFSTTKTLQ